MKSDSSNVTTGFDRWFAAGSSGRDNAPEHDRKFVVALARGLEILRAFTPTDCLLGNQEIAARTGLPKATVSRLTYTLNKLGYLTHVARLSRYQLAPATLSLGYTALSNIRIRDIARPHMQELADYAGASVGLATRDRLNLIYIEHCISHPAVTMRLDLGSRIPMSTTAMGKAMLAVLPDSEREWLMIHMSRREGERWPKIRAGIERAIKELETHGFVLSIGDWQPDISAVGVALIPPDGSGVFGFNCGAPAFRLSKERLETEIGPRLVNVVRNVEAALTGR